ncbi:MAG: di-heme oxidoredictase family protein, partial [Planctomycetota bacterium]
MMTDRSLRGANNYEPLAAKAVGLAWVVASSLFKNHSLRSACFVFGWLVIGGGASVEVAAADPADVLQGRLLFEKEWRSQNSALGNDGLGPLFNARSCQRCHIKDGRGHAPDGDNAISFLMRISIPADIPAQMAEIEGYLGRSGDPNYGGQI